MNRVLCACLLMASTPGYAYQFEVDGQYGVSFDEPSGIENKQYQAGVTWWLGDVSTQGIPLAEAGFLAQESSLRIAAGRDDTTLGVDTPVGAMTFDTELDRYSVSFNYVHESGFIIGGSIARTETEQSNISFGADEIDELGLNLGYYLTDSLTLEGVFTRAEADDRMVQQLTCPPALSALLFACVESLTTEFDSDVDTLGLRLKYVGAILNQSFGIVAQFAQQETEVSTRTEAVLVDQFGGRTSNTFSADSDTEADVGSLDLTWYPLDSLGVTVGYVRQSFDSNALNSDRDTYLLGAQWFVIPSLYLAAAVSREDVGTPTGDDDLSAANVSIGFRW